MAEKHDELTFGNKRFLQTLSSHKEVLDKYYDGFDIAKNLGGNSKIFLDTNILLRIYSTSFKARAKLLIFFKQYKSRIVLTSQVQWEYIKNRENLITKFNEEVTQNIPNNFKSKILENIKKFTTDNKEILTDYTVIQESLEKLQKQAEELLESINSEVKNEKVSSNTIFYKDEFLSIFQELELLAPLDKDYTQQIKSEFNNFLKDFEIQKEAFRAFPGCNEKKEKNEDPYGDYIIYHEMMSYAKKNKTDIIFLTYDITKGDWMQLNKNPHLHYVENFYQNTGKLIFILNGERALDELLDTDFKSLLKPANYWSNSKTSNNVVYALLTGPLDQMDRSILFSAAGNFTMSQLAYFNSSARPEILKLAATGFATTLDRTLINAYLCSYRKGQTQGQTIDELVNVLLNGQNTISDLAEVIENCYLFLS